MNGNVSPALRSMAWKIAFLFTLGTFILLGLGLLITAAIQTNQVSIIGGADLPTFRLKLSLLLSSTLGLALDISFLLSIITFIGWRRRKQKQK
jgi:uncharacterized BrkB/YihY/UPF0761 family membrane protein